MLNFQAYRVYVVWQRQWVSLIVPVFLLVGDFGMCLGSSPLTLRPGLDVVHAVAAVFATKALTSGPRTYYPILAPNASVELVAYFAMTLLTNVVTTRESRTLIWGRASDLQPYRKCSSSGGCGGRTTG